MLTDDVKAMVIDDITATIHTLETNTWDDCSVFSGGLVRLVHRQGTRRTRHWIWHLLTWYA